VSATSTPPGYASPERDTPATAYTLPFPLAAFAAGLASTLLLCLHTLCVALPRAYSVNGQSNAFATWLVLLSLSAGALVGRKVERASVRAPSALALLSALASASGYAFFFSFSRRAALDVTELLFPLLCAFVLGLAASLALRAFGSGFATLGLLEYFLNPVRAALLGASWLLVLYALPILGLLRQGALFGALLAGFAVLTPRVATLFALEARLPRPARNLLVFPPFLALSSLLGAGFWVPLEAVQSHAGEVLSALDGPRGTHVVSKLQGGLVLFSNQVVASTSTDATRFAEALVHPALAAANERDRVLVLDDAAGAVTREVLRWPGVRRVTLLPSDPALLDLARSSNAFRALGADALDSPRVELRTEEPAVFVLGLGPRFPLILANLADPSSYLASKYYTVRFFEAVRKRLAPGGLFALQVTSPERTPGTHASIMATLRKAGLAALAYRAPLPTLGEWGFALATDASACAGEPGPAHDGAPRSPEANCRAAEQRLAERVRGVRGIPAGTSLVTPATLGSLFAARDAARNASAHPNFLYEQALLETYQAEEHALIE
jgi:spermidine synthase